MEIFTIKKSEEGKRLDQFLMEQKHWPRAFFMKALRTKKIKVNGRKEEAAFRLSAGDEVRSFVLEKRDALRPVRILYEDENLLVVYKPAGILTLDITGKEKDTMLSRVSAALLQKGGVAAYPVHRIDFNTEGLLLLQRQKRSVTSSAVSSVTARSASPILPSSLERSSRDTGRSPTRSSRMRKESGLRHGRTCEGIEDGHHRVRTSRVQERSFAREVPSHHRPYPSDPQPDGACRASAFGG